MFCRILVRGRLFLCQLSYIYFYYNTVRLLYILHHSRSTNRRSFTLSDVTNNRFTIRQIDFISSFYLTLIRKVGFIYNLFFGWCSEFHQKQKNDVATIYSKSINYSEPKYLRWSIFNVTSERFIATTKHETCRQYIYWQEGLM